MTAPISIRDSTDADIAAIQAIYAHHVVHGRGSFEEIPPGIETMAERRAALLAKGLPYIVAVRADKIVGYAYAGPFRPRAAYRYSLEDSIYVAPDAVGGGIGRGLLVALLARAEAWGARQMVAVIGDSANAGSIGLHKSLGFRMVGVFEAIGYKHGRWVDSVMMQRPLGRGSDAPPEEKA
ncbi:MAG: N-acetyltransferase [Telmatospirillum sp.]|nr:N-acetyltransferase [Telmatospirillum sp.]